MKSLILLVVLSACCFAQDLQTGELHSCPSTRPGIKKCDGGPPFNNTHQFYHLITKDDQKEYVFVRGSKDHMMGAVYYRIDGSMITVYWYLADATTGHPVEERKLFTRRLLNP